MKKGRTQIGLIQQILVGYGKGLGCFWDILGGYAGLARRLRRCSHGSKTNTDSTDVTDLSFHGSFLTLFFGSFAPTARIVPDFGCGVNCSVKK